MLLISSSTILFNISEHTLLFFLRPFNHRLNIVGCTKSEPEPGWLENMNGPTGMITGVIVGFLRMINLATDKVTDIIPADYTANALISVMWDTVKR
eukprot:XP_016665111.1 PREDICTED: fatty acyl-CoA reductase 2-like [Acyrthosiphon pisum]